MAAQAAGLLVCLMHMQGAPANHAIGPHYENLLAREIHDYFQQRIAACVAAGIPRERLGSDPGILVRR